MKSPLAGPYPLNPKIKTTRLRVAQHHVSNQRIAHHLLNRRLLRSIRNSFTPSNHLLRIITIQHNSKRQQLRRIPRRLLIPLTLCFVYKHRPRLRYRRDTLKRIKGKLHSHILTHHERSQQCRQGPCPVATFAVPGCPYPGDNFVSLTLSANSLAIAIIRNTFISSLQSLCSTTEVIFQHKHSSTHSQSLHQARELRVLGHPFQVPCE